MHQIVHSQQVVIADNTNIQEIINKYTNKNITIRISKGEYLNAIHVPGSITIIADKEAIIYAPVIISGANINITNINIKIIPYGSERAIYILNSHNVSLTNVQIEGGPIIIHNSSNIKLIDIRVRNVTFPVFDIINSTNIIIINLNIEKSYKLAKICNSTNIEFTINKTNTKIISLCEKQDKNQIKLYNITEKESRNNTNSIIQNKTITTNTKPKSTIITDKNTDTANPRGHTNKSIEIRYIIALILVLVAVLIVWRKKR